MLDRATDMAAWAELQADLVTSQYGIWGVSDGGAHTKFVTIGRYTTEFITEYCNDNLNAKEHITAITRVAMLFDQFNFDMLKALVEEMNRYGESPQDALKMLNAKPEFNNNGKFEIQLIINGEQCKDNGVRTEWNGNPLNTPVYFEWYGKTDYQLGHSNAAEIGIAIATADDDGDFWNEINFTPNNIVKVDAAAGKFTYQKDNAFCILTRKKESGYNYLAF